MCLRLRNRGPEWREPVTVGSSCCNAGPGSSGNGARREGEGRNTCVGLFRCSSAMERTGLGLGLEWVGWDEQQALEASGKPWKIFSGHRLGIMNCVSFLGSSFPFTPCFYLRPILLPHVSPMNMPSCHLLWSHMQGPPRSLCPLFCVH